MAKKKEEVIETGNKDRALDLLKATIEKKYGKHTILTYEGPEENFTGQCIGTGILSLDRALGKPIPRGRIIEIYGPESNGKTTLALQILGRANKAFPDLRQAYIDAEHSLDLEYATRLIGRKDFEYNQPSSGEEGLDILDMMVRSSLYSAIVVDSVAALVPQKELEGEMGDSNMGVHARLMSQAMRKLAGIAHETDTAIIFLNQIRMKIGVMFGNPETTTGGNALKFYASQRLELRRTGVLKEGDDAQPYGITSKVKAIKNKVAAPFREAELDLIFGEGFDTTRDLVKCAVAAGVIEKSGAWYAYKTEKIGQGFDNTLTFLKDNPKLMDEIETTTRQALGVL